MDLLDFMVYGMVFGWIGAMLLAGVLGWIWNRTRGCVKDFWHDWREFRAMRRRDRKRESVLREQKRRGMECRRDRAVAPYIIYKD